MVKYTPPPENLDHLNAVQRYMQKGSLDQEDWLRLATLVLFYWLLRPYIQKLAQKLYTDSEVKEGEKEQADYAKRRAKAKIGANAIRGQKEKEEVEDVAEIAETEEVVASGNAVGDGKKAAAGKVTNRKGNRVSFAPERSGAAQLLDWDDEPARPVTDGDKNDVMAWLDKWDK